MSLAHLAQGRPSRSYAAYLIGLLLLAGLIIWGWKATSNRDWVQYQFENALLRHDEVSTRSAIRSGADVNDTHLPLHAPLKIFRMLGVSRNPQVPYFCVLWADRREGNPLNAPPDEGASLLRLLLASGANPNMYYGEQSALFQAEERGYLTSMALLLEHGADANCTDHRYPDPVIEAARSDVGEEVALLVKHGADVNARDPDSGYTPLMIACAHDCPNTVNALLRLGAATALTSHSGESAFTLAKSNPRILKLLNSEGTRAVDPMPTPPANRSSAGGPREPRSH